MLVYIRTITGKHFSHFYYLVQQKEKNCRHRNFVLQHDYISKLLTFKTDAQFLLKTFRKKFRSEENLNKVLKQHRQQDCKTII